MILLRRELRIIIFDVDRVQEYMRNSPTPLPQKRWKLYNLVYLKNILTTFLRFIFSTNGNFWKNNVPSLVME